jgi:hypothetical protein
MSSDLFEAPGIELSPVPPKPARKLRKPFAAEIVASGRLGAARRSRTPQRYRVGPGRDLAPAEVVPFPLHRNTALVAQVTARLPHGYAPDLDRACAKETRAFRDALVSRGFAKQPAWVCARTLLHHAYMKRVHDAHMKAVIL